MQDILSSIIAAEKTCGDIMLKHKAHHITDKSSSRDLVTEYDSLVQSMLISKFSAEIPDARFFCEEDNRHDSLSAKHVFIIDPIDGTMNFVRHMNLSCISVAYASYGETLAAAVYNPFTGEMFHAEKGGGAFLNGNPITAENCRLAETVVSCGTDPYDPEKADFTFGLIKKLFVESLDIRRCGSAALDLCTVAAGRSGLYMEAGVSLWDYAAGALIAREAGAECYDFDGNMLGLKPGRTSIVCGCKNAVDDFFNKILLF